MDRKIYPLSFHFKELKIRLVYIIIAYIFSVGIIYIFSEQIYQFLANPLKISLNNPSRKMIYTNLGEVFFSYLKLSTTLAFNIIIPIIAYNFYKFIAPGLHLNEKKPAIIILSLSPLLYWTGIVFCYLIVIPKAWAFFQSFETQSSLIPIILEAKVGEYLQLIIDLTFAFGMAFQLPIILLILTLLRIININTLKSKRRFAIVIMFLISGILTPPDVFSQFALAIPLLLLYEISIQFCKIVENKEDSNVRPRLDC